ncbi:hypothetical protein CPB83DRAFT_47300 [Crepidotus variabilis]|uniref:Uncharacterized protein n=1 Tax=Crepidotus variabilis TaxID=179855 RepID=A0A9P6ELE7_9AGAR|nr:hypothetical protein CPB83DRAFT_47300 [Crepidotus variabilis]
MDGPSSATSANSRQKRVLPSRSRRGGPGLGTCDVDNLILETRRRKYENEPLIPAETHFLLTTDPAYDAEPSDGSHSGMKINIVANERYFDRPDVLKAFREQILIQTPEFHELQELASGVGSRFRPRNQEEVGILTLCSAKELIPWFDSRCQKRQMQLTRNGIKSSKPMKNDSAFERKRNSNTNTTSSRNASINSGPWKGQRL